MKRRTMLALMGATSAGWLASPSYAARSSYPSAPVRMVVPYAAGGGIDAVARMLAQGMGEELHQPVVVDNRAGAGGMLGAEVAAKAQPDGYTILLAGNPELNITPQLQAKTSYSAVNDFAPVVLVSQSPNILVANPSLGAKTLREALDAAKKKGDISIGTPGNGSPQHIAVEVLRMQTGMDIMHVPYKGAGPATVAALGGEVSFALVGAPPVLSHINSGKLVAFAVTQPKRSPLVPNVPTIGEALGMMQNDDFVTWYGLLVPAKTPPEIVDVLSKAAFSVLNRSDSRSRLAVLGTDLVAMPAGPFAERMRRETQVYGEIIKKFGIKAT